MAQEALVQQLAALGALLKEVDARLAQVPVAPEGLEHLKQSVDNLRTSMWAILRAGHGLSAPARVERLKLRRAIDGLRAIQQDLSDRPDGPHHPEHDDLAAVARAVALQLAERASRQGDRPS
jgi:hypothetical protein